MISMGKERETWLHILINDPYYLTMKRQWIKQIEIRCPWCGELIEYKFGWHGLRFLKLSRIEEYCLHCHKVSQRDSGVFLKISYVFDLASGISLIWGGTHIINKNWLFGLSLLFLYIIFDEISWFFYYLGPCERTSGGVWYERLYPYSPPTAVADITWVPDGKRKTSYLKWQIVEKSILPACFVDESNQPASDVWCIVVEESKDRKYNQSKIEFHFLSDDAPGDLLKEGYRFILFNERSKIGEGVIKEIRSV